MKQINELYLRLIKASVVKLLGVVSDEYIITNEEIYKLLSYASILSLSDNVLDRSKSYEIVSRVFEVATDFNPKLINAADLILSRIGNFPGRLLMRNRFNRGEEPDLSLPFSLERIAREVENSFDDKKLTDFQYNLFASLEKYSSLRKVRTSS